MPILKNILTDTVSCLDYNPPLSVSINATVEKAIQALQTSGRGCVLVVDGDDLKGIFTERDILIKILAEHVDQNQPVKSYMSESPTTISSNDKVADVVKLMRKGGYRHFPIIGDNREIIGILSVKHIVHYLVDHFPEAIYNLPPEPDQHAGAREGA